MIGGDTIGSHAVGEFIDEFLELSTLGPISPIDDGGQASKNVIPVELPDYIRLFTGDVLATFTGEAILTYTG